MTSPGPKPFTAHTRQVLRTAHHAIWAAAESEVAVFTACRVAMECLARVDTFYVALIREDSRETAIPYTVDQGRVLTPDVLPYGPNGLTQWILASRRTYRYGDDGGILIGRGHRFGDPLEEDCDAIVSPLIHPDTGNSTGFIAVLSVNTNEFTDEHVHALEWLAHATAVALHLERRARQMLDLDAINLPTESRSPLTSGEQAAVVISRVEQIRQRLMRFGSLLPEGGEAARELRDALIDCESLQADVAVMAGRGREDPLAVLTARERQIVEMIAAGADSGNREIAHRLGLAETTVKTHVAKALEKLHLANRTEFRWLLRQNGNL